MEGTWGRVIENAVKKGRGGHHGGERRFSASSKGKERVSASSGGGSGGRALALKNGLGEPGANIDFPRCVCALRGLSETRLRQVGGEKWPWGPREFRVPANRRGPDDVSRGGGAPACARGGREKRRADWGPGGWFYGGGLKTLTFFRVTGIRRESFWETRPGFTIGKIGPTGRACVR